MLFPSQCLAVSGNILTFSVTFVVVVVKLQDTEIAVEGYKWFGKPRGNQFLVPST